MRKLKLFFACLLMAVLSIGQVWGESVTYTASSASAVSTTGTAPEGSSAALSGTGTFSSPWIQCTNGKSKTLTLSGYEGYKITAITIHVKSNSSKGTGSFEVIAGSTTIASIPESAFNSDNWNKAWNTTGVDKVLTMTNDDYEIQENEEVTLTINCKSGSSNYNSLYIKSYTITYEAVGGGDVIVKTLKSIAVSGQTTTYDQFAPFSFDGTCTATYSVTQGGEAQPDENKTVTPTSVSSPDMSTTGEKEVTVSFTDGDVTKTVDYTITVNPHTVTPGTYNIVPNNAFWGTSYTGTDAAAADQLSGSQDDISIVHTKSGSNLYVNDSQTRAYNGHTMAISVPTGYVITDVVFTTGTWEGTPNVSTGDMTDSKTWEGSANSLTFTFTAKSFINNIAVTYEEVDQTIVKTLKSIAVSEMTTSYEVGDVFSFDGICTATYTVTQGGEAQPDENKTVNPTSVSTPDMNTTGEKTVTVTYEENEVSKTVDYTINVNPHTVTPGSYPVLLNNVLWGVEAGQQAATVNSMEGSANDINFATTKGSNQMYASATQTRFYTNATLTISAPTGYNITSVVFAEPSSDKQWNGSISADEGTYTADTKTWSGEVAAVVFTFGAQNRIGTATVTYAAVDPTAPAVSVASSIDNVPAAGVAGQVLDVTYTNVDLANVVYALFNDAECQNAFTDEWLSVSLNGDKDIVYTLSANTSFTEGRTAYIQLTAPADNGTSPAVVKVIAVEQLTKEYVFASLAELLENITPTTTPVNVTVTLTNEVITGFAYGGNQNQYKNGVKFNVNYGVGQSQEMEIYFHDVPGEWVAGGKISGTLTNCPWKIYSGTWELAPSTGWAWDNGDLSYTAPKAVTGVEVSGQPETKVYTVGETFNPEGLTVTVSYNEGDPEVNPVGVTFTTDPANGKMALEQTSIKVKATFNNVTSEEWFTVNGLTVNDLETKTIAQFVAAGGGRCYLIGTVSNITNTQYGNFDLTDASGTIFVYGCLDTNGASKNFENLNVEEDDYIKVIAETYEYYQQTTHEAKNVQFVEELEKPVVPTVTLKQAGSTVTSLNLDATGVATQAIDIVCGNFADAISSVSAVLYEESICETEITSGAWVTDITIDGAKLTFNIADNAGDARQVWLKVTASDGTNSAFAVLAISQAKYTVDYAELPFAYDGNGSGELPNGFTNSGVGTYSSSPAMKFDGTGDYIIIKINAAPGTLTYDIKGNSFSGGTFKVQQSANGVDYSDVATYTELGSTQSEAKTLDETTRYVKFIYTEKVSGNVGLGNITIAPQYETIRGGLTSGNYYTVCYNRKMKEIRGASLWSFVGNEGNKVSIVEAEAPYAAGTPYLVYAESDKLEAIVEVVDNPSAGNNNGLYGTFSYMDADALSTAGATHMLKNNEIRPLGNNNHLDANRAYIILDNIDAVQPAPGRRVRAIPMQSNVVTGCDEINASETPVKMIIDGQIFILRGEKMYDTTGRLVK